MKRGFFVFGFIFTAALGTILHFLYDWVGKSPVVAFVSAVNESTWEHLKLLYVPMVLFGIYEYFRYGRDTACFFPAKFKGILSGMLFIVLFFYGYRGILGYNLDFLNILDFYFGSAVAWTVQYKALKSKRSCSPISHGIALFGIVILGVLFAVFSFYPPSLGIFIPPEV